MAALIQLLALRLRLAYIEWALASQERYRAELAANGFGGCGYLVALDAEIEALRCECFAIGNRLRPVRG